MLGEIVVHRGAGLWFEAVIWDVTLAEIVTEVGSGVWAGMLIGLEVAHEVWTGMLIGVGDGVRFQIVVGIGVWA